MGLYLKQSVISLLLLIVVVLCCCFVITSEAAPKKQPKATCGYDSCPKGKPGVINVHVVPHTHDDVGWLKTVDQYYYGSRTVYQKAGVQYIIDSVVKELLKDPARRFIYVEMAFFTQWWQEQTEETRDSVRQLVAEGRLEFINGGWCMNDEATTHYNDIIDQMSLGLKFLNDTFGECGRPRVAWQIDPFGHSREQASLFAQMGYDGMFFARIDQDDKNNRLNNREMEMIWKASNTLGDGGSIFAGTLFNHYSAPSGFCFDVKCNDAPFIDNKKSADYNVIAKITQLSAMIRAQNISYRTGHIMFTMGDDFNYMTADMNFKNMDKMIRYANELDNGVNLFYSTPSCYVKALNEAGVTWPTKTDDFFPYSSDPHGYWTGYFTSRPTFKGTVRKTNTFLQSCKQIHSLAYGQEIGKQDRIDSLRQSMGTAQHHDAVTGTEKQHVSEDYRQRIHEGTVDCEQDINDSFNKMLRIGNDPLPEQQFCLMLNVSQCEVTETNSRFVATVYNPRSQEQTTYIRLPVTNGIFTVIDPDGSELVTQLVPLSEAALQLIKNERANSIATHELVFQAAKLPPIGHKSFYIQKSLTAKTQMDTKRSFNQLTKVWKAKEGESVSITNEKVTAVFDTDGLLSDVIVDGVQVPVSQNLLWYPGNRQGSTGSGDLDRPSGAYIFRPNGTEAFTISDTATSVTVYQGSLVQEVHQQFSDWASQIVRIYKGHADIEIEWTIGSIPVDDGVPKEIINRVVTGGIASRERFYSDSNGRQTLMRQRDFRPTWQYKVVEPVSGNYYPVNSHIYLTDREENANVVMALVNDRSQGGSSLRDGELELMVHRRLLDDDHKGVGEALNEHEQEPDLPIKGPGLPVRGTHYLLIDPNLSGRHPMSLVRPLAQNVMMKPWVSFGVTDFSYTKWKNSFLMKKSGLTEPLQDNLHILTLEPWGTLGDATHLLRLEHVYDAGEHPTLSQPINVALDDLLADYTIESAEETTLGANQWAASASRFSWSTVDSIKSIKKKKSSSFFNGKAISVSMEPMEIKTFIISLARK